MKIDAIALKVALEGAGYSSNAADYIVDAVREYEKPKEYTLAQEKARLINGRKKGTHCGACGQFVKEYARQIHSTIAKALIMAYKLAKQSVDGSFHINDILKDRDTLKAYGDIQKTRVGMWGLVESVPKDENEPRGGRTSGLWKLTQLGKDFVEGKVTVPRRVYVYDNQKTGEEADKQVTIYQCLNKGFDYNEFMNRPIP